MRSEFDYRLQASFCDRTNHREEGFASVQNEPCVVGAGLRSCLRILPCRKYTLGLSSVADDTRLAQADSAAVYYPDASEANL